MVLIEMVVAFSLGILGYRFSRRWRDMMTIKHKKIDYSNVFMSIKILVRLPPPGVSSGEEECSKYPFLLGKQTFSTPNLEYSVVKR